jgi:hypothetical protein
LKTAQANAQKNKHRRTFGGGQSRLNNSPTGF